MKPGQGIKAKKGVSIGGALPLANSPTQSRSTMLPIPRWNRLKNGDRILVQVAAARSSPLQPACTLKLSPPANSLLLIYWHSQDSTTAGVLICNCFAAMVRVA